MEVHIFTCDICPKTFRSKQTLHRHVRIHKFGKQFRCCYCEKSYTRRYLLTDHKVRCHGVEKAPQVPIWLPKAKSKVDIIKRKYFRPSAASQLFSEGREDHAEGEQLNVENENEGGDYHAETSAQMSPDDGSNLIISNVQSLSEAAILQSGNRRNVQAVDDASYNTEGNIHNNPKKKKVPTADAYMVHEFHEQNASGTNGSGMPHPISMEMINIPDDHSRDGTVNDPKGINNQGGNTRHNTEVGADAMSTTDTEESSRLERLLTEGLSSPHYKGERDSPSKLSSNSSVNDLKTNTVAISRQGKISTRASSGKAIDSQSRQVITTKWGCDHCGIYFTDQVLYFLHSGFHARSNAFQCNSCGHISQNKYEFNTHIYSQKHY